MVAVVTGEDAPNPYGILPVGHDETALAVEKVRYVGDHVACVAAVSEEIAEHALELIDVEYEPLPAYFDPEESMKAESDLIHENRPHNIEKDYHHVFGDPDKGFAEADYIAEGRYIANEVTHAAMEPHCTLANFELDPHTGKLGRLTVWSSTQVPYYLQHKLSLVLEMPMSQIRVIKPLVGGGFGGKSEIIPLEIIAAVAARAAKAPVKITYTREEVFWAHRGRPRTIIDLKTGVKNDGRMTAVACKVIQDGGAYCSYGVVTILYSGALLGALYDIPNIRYDGYRVLTNKPACGAMRGHGTVNVRFAFESQMDEIAAKLNLDPAEVRRVNLLKPPTVTVNGLRVLSYGLPECIDQVVTRSGWKERKGKLPKGRGLGRGLQPLCERRGQQHHPLRHAALDGEHQDRSRRRRGGLHRRVGDRARLRHHDRAGCGGGAGLRTGAGQGHRRRYRPDAHRSRFLLQPRDFHGRQCRPARRRRREEEHRQRGRQAHELRSGGCDHAQRPRVEARYHVVRLQSHIVRYLEEKDAARGHVDGQILRGSVLQTRKEEGPKDHMSFEEAVVSAIDFHGALTGTGSYAPPVEARGGKHKGGGVGPSPAYSYSAQVAEVSVDEETGEVTVHKIWAAHDCGRALNPVAVEGQVIGSVWMGLGQALEEEMVWKDGLLMNPGMLEYRSPSSAESPEIECIIVESIDPEGPFGAKEAGEGSLAATIPAISNAIYDAVGVRLREAPFTPERILSALRAKKGMKRIEMTESVDPTAPAQASRTWRLAVVPRQGPDAASARSGATGHECRLAHGR